MKVQIARRRFHFNGEMPLKLRLKASLAGGDAALRTVDMAEALRTRQNRAQLRSLPLRLAADFLCIR